MAELRLIVGLGNPGPDYIQTRHNAGFWFVDALANRYQGQFSAESKFSSEICKVRIGRQDVWLQKPQQFMNRSGLPVRKLMDFYKIDMSQILIAHDEIDLEPGVCRLKSGGGHGGHNGLRDLFSHVGKDFWRLRIGVGHPGSREQVVNFVLGRPSRDESIVIEHSLDQAERVAEDIVSGEFPRAMNTLHSNTP